MSRFKERIIHPLEYALFRVVMALVVVCPHRAARLLGRGLGTAAWGVLGVRRKEVLASLGLAFPEKSPAELAGIGACCYRSLGEFFIEMFRIHRLSTDWMQRHIDFQGREVLDSALAGGRGVINVTFHYGNWELMGAFAARLGYPLDVIARSQQNRFFQRYVAAAREACGMRLFPVSASPGKVARSLREGRIVSFLADQDSHHQGVFVDFLGRPASTPKGPALFAHKTGAPVVLSLMIPRGDGKYTLRFEPVPRPETGNREEFIFRMTAYFTGRLAEQVRSRPEYWFWPHRRWKTRPPDSPAGAC
ncbi:MAG: lysophospholipid acyltransferase family protein [Candidatus Glassbacteria bacterium]|nr:lysophospholipid acyltransferase family protein [Candidatus Glassbacteria bacterium]